MMVMKARPLSTSFHGSNGSVKPLTILATKMMVMKARPLTTSFHGSNGSRFSPNSEGTGEKSAITSDISSITLLSKTNAFPLLKRIKGMKVSERQRIIERKRDEEEGENEKKRVAEKKKKKTSRPKASNGQQFPCPA